MESRVTRVVGFYNRGERDITPDQIADRLKISVHLARQVRRLAENELYLIATPPTPELSRLCSAYEKLREWCIANERPFKETIIFLINRHLENPTSRPGASV